MTLQNVLKTLKTAKKTLPSSLNTQFPQTLSKTLPNDLSSYLQSLTSHKFQLFLSDPNAPTSDCLQIFNAVLRLQSDLSFTPDLHSHLTLICRLIKSRKFTDAEFLLKNAAFHRNYRYPFTDFASWVENYCNQSRIITKLLNMLLKMYSDHNMFDMASNVFDYMVDKGFERDERTCSILLYALTKNDHVDLALEFFRRMSDSGMEVSVYSLTIVVSGLCKVGELKMARQLVEEISEKGVKPNIITMNTLLDACARRWDLVELDLVLSVMREERVEFNDTSYKILILGYSSCVKVEEAEKLLVDMHDNGFDMEIYLFYTVIRGYCRLGNISNGLSLLRVMQEWKLGPNIDIYWCLISELCKVGEMSPVKELVKEMQNKGGDLDNDMLNTLADAYNKGGMMDEFAGLKCMLKMKCSSVEISSQNFVVPESEIEFVSDSDSEIELLVDDETKTMTLEEMDYGSR